MKKTIRILFIFILLIAIGLGTYFGVQRYREYKKYEPLRTDLERISTEKYDAVFFSTFPITHFTEEDFLKYREIESLNASYCIPDLATLTDYLDRAAATDNRIDIVYLGIRPDIVTVDDLIELMASLGDRYYEIVIAYPSLNYWKGLSEEEYLTQLDAYRDFISQLMPLYEENEWLQNYLAVYFYGNVEWLVANSANYESDFGINEGMSHILSMYTDAEHGYQLTPETYETALETFETLVQDCRAKADDPTPEYPDLSDWDVTFFGDSIIAFSETTSIPGAFSGLTGAHIYNCAIGGSTAAVAEGTVTPSGVAEVVDIFLSKDLKRISEDSKMYAGMYDYVKYAKKKRQKCFVLGFGMNDFFVGAPIRNDADPYDTATYTGALRTAVEKLQTAYPDAVILLIAPNYTVCFENGQGIQSAVGGTLPQYVDAMKTLSEEKGLLFYNSYTELNIDIKNQANFLLDGCHPNEITRYRMACDLAKLFR